jgi:hypothetical protein
VALGGSGLTDEGYVSLHGDMGKYLMNGVFILDLAKDRPFGSLHDVIDYTRHYYARYPELSLGHHPMVLPAAEAPMFALFGISVMSARLVMLVSILTAVVYLYLLVNDLYGVSAAFFAAALFATSPIVIFLTRSVMSEMPALGLMMAAVYYFHRFCATQRRGPLAVFVATAVLSLYAKQLVIWILPALIVPAVMNLGVKRLLRSDVIVAAVAAAALLVPLVALTLQLSPTNLAMIGEIHRQARIDMMMLVRSAIAEQLTPPTVWLAACGVVVAIARLDRRLVMFVVWIASVFGGLYITGIIEPVHHLLGAGLRGARRVVRRGCRQHRHPPRGIRRTAGGGRVPGASGGRPEEYRRGGRLRGGGAFRPRRQSGADSPLQRRRGYRLLHVLHQEARSGAPARGPAIGQGADDVAHVSAQR